MIWSSPTRGTWIEMWSSWRWTCRASSSSPTRGTWIEIAVQGLGTALDPYVVPHAGDVDRNPPDYFGAIFIDVVPHAGDVDRNTTQRCRCLYW